MDGISLALFTWLPWDQGTLAQASLAAWTCLGIGQIQHLFNLPNRRTGFSFAEALFASPLSSVSILLAILGPKETLKMLD